MVTVYAIVISGGLIVMKRFHDEKMFLRRVHAAIFYGALLSAFAAIFIFWNWLAVVLTGAGIFAGFSVSYAVIASVSGLPRLGWRAFFAELRDRLSV